VSLLALSCAAACSACCRSAGLAGTSSSYCGDRGDGGNSAGIRRGIVAGDGGNTGARSAIGIVAYARVRLVYSDVELLPEEAYY